MKNTLIRVSIAVLIAAFLSLLNAPKTTAIEEKSHKTRPAEIK